MTKRTVALLAAVILVTGGGYASAQGRQRLVMWMTGVGNAQDQSRRDADADAEDQATEDASRACIGRIEKVQRVSGGCFTFGSGDRQVYNCTVTVKAECVVN